jgi:hypothetical protein
MYLKSIDYIDNANVYKYSINEKFFEISFLEEKRLSNC